MPERKQDDETLGAVRQLFDDYVCLSDQALVTQAHGRNVDIEAMDLIKAREVLAGLGQVKNVARTEDGRVIWARRRVS